MKHFLMALGLFCFLFQDLAAQHILLLQRGGNEKTRLIYQAGEEIIYRQRGVDYFYTDIITEIQEDIVVLRENVIAPKDIEVVDIRLKDKRNQTIRNLSTLTAGAGLLWLTAETINSIYIDGRLSYSTGGLILAGSLFAGSALISLTKYKYFRHKGRNTIRIVYLEEEGEIEEGRN